MNEKQIISQLKGLKSVKPAKDWAVLVKRDLLTEAPELRHTQAQTNFGETIFSFFARPAFVVSSLIVVGCVVMGTFAYFGLQKQNYDLQAYIDSLTSQNTENQLAIAGLVDVQNKMDEVKEVLKSLKLSNDSKKVLAATEVVKSTAKNSQIAIEQIKNSSTDLSKQTLTSLGKVKETSLELEKTSIDLQTEVFKAYLAELKTKTLNQEDKERLMAAEEYFANGQIEDAITLLVRIGETTE